MDWLGVSLLVAWVASVRQLFNCLRVGVTPLGSDCVKSGKPAVNSALDPLFYGENRNQSHDHHSLDRVRAVKSWVWRAWA